MEMINPTLYDQFFDHLPLWKALNGRKKVKKSGSGESIHYEVSYGKDDRAKSYADYGILHTNPTEFMMRAFYTWKQYAVPVTISGMDKAKNSGDKTKIIDLLEAKTKNAISSLRDDLSVATFASGGGNDIVGLQSLVADTPTTGTVGNLNAATYSWWRNQYTNTAGSFAGGGLGYMRTMFNNCTFGTDQPDILVTTQTVHEYYEGALQPQERFTSTKQADGGIETLKFRGASVFFDRDCGSGRMYFLNSDYLDLWILNGQDFKAGKFITPPEQDVSISQIFFKGALTVPARRYHGIITGISA